MEDQGFQPEDEAVTDAVASRKKRRGADFLAQYLFRRQPESPSHATSEDVDESDEKPRRWRGMFDRVFSNVVEQPKEPVATEPTERPFDSNFWYQWQSTDLPPVAAESLDAGALFAETEALGSEIQETPEEPIDVPPQNRTTFERPMPAGLAAPSEIQPTAANRRSDILLPMALVGREQLARKKADKQINKKIDQESKRSKEINVNSEAAQAELEKLVEQNRQQLEVLRHDRAERIVPPTPIEHSKEAKPPVVEPRPELVPMKALEQARSQVVFERVIDAAEHSQPVERIYERSHEIKDQTSLPPASSVGTVLAAKAPNGFGQPSGSSTRADDEKLSTPLVSADAMLQTKTYRQSMYAGFWSAIMIIIIGGIAYLM